MVMTTAQRLFRFAKARALRTGTLASAVREMRRNPQDAARECDTDIDSVVVWCCAKLGEPR
jgi:hypothetical protein